MPFEKKELDKIKKSVGLCIEEQKKKFEEIVKELEPIRNNVRTIKERSIQSLSFFSCDGGNSKIGENPFFLHVIKVSDSKGRKQSLDIISAESNIRELSAKHLFEKTDLGLLMRDLGCRSLNELSSVLPKEKSVNGNTRWVNDYRNLLEWATIYKKICYETPSDDILIIKDGLLRSKTFSVKKNFFGRKKSLFIEMMKRLDKAIEEAYQNNKTRIYLVGLAKRNAVTKRYEYALNSLDFFLPCEPVYLPIPEEIEMKSYNWGQDYVYHDDTVGREENKHAYGKLNLVRFSKNQYDAIWGVDVMPSQVHQTQKIMGNLLADAKQGFPIPYYPNSVQRAHDNSAISPFAIDVIANIIEEQQIDKIGDFRKIFKINEAKKRYI